MPALPTTGLTGAPIADHIGHHEDVHAFYNLGVLNANADGVGTTLVRIAAADDIASWGNHHRHFVLPEQVITHTHSTAGALTFTVEARHRAVKVNASDDITGATINGMELSGAEFSTLYVLLVATANISVDLSGGSNELIGSVPAALTTGDSVPFQVQRWNF